LAKLDSSAAAPRRSKTATSWPSEASSHAVVTPMIPAPTIAIFIVVFGGEMCGLTLR
jgi:hypothetical protein